MAVAPARRHAADRCLEHPAGAAQRRAASVADLHAVTRDAELHVDAARPSGRQPPIDIAAWCAVVNVPSTGSQVLSPEATPTTVRSAKSSATVSVWPEA